MVSLREDDPFGRRTAAQRSEGPVLAERTSAKSTPGRTPAGPVVVVDLVSSVKTH